MWICSNAHNKQMHVWYKLNITSQESQLVRGWPVGYLRSEEKLNSVAGRRIWIQDLQTTSSAPYHQAMLASS